MLPTILLAGVIFVWKPNSEPDIIGYNLYLNNTQLVAFIPHPLNSYETPTLAGKNFYRLTAVNSDFIESLPTKNLMTEKVEITILNSSDLFNWKDIGIHYNVTNFKEAEASYYKLEIK